MIARLLRGLFSRPTTQPDVPSPLDIEDRAAGLTPGVRAWLADRGYSEFTINAIDADQRAANEVRR